MTALRTPAVKRTGSRSPKRPFNLSRLGEPLSECDLIHLLPGFETEGNAADEDRRRLVGLERLLAECLTNSPHHDYHPSTTFPGERTQQLIDQLASNDERHQARQTFASARYLRSFRRRFCGAVLELLQSYPRRGVRLYTIVAQQDRFAADQLDSFEPKRLLERTRLRLIRAGVSDLPGWFIAYVHGEYDPGSDTFQPHLHVLVTGAKARAFEKLRSLSVYRSSPAVLRPILARRNIKSEDWVRQITYHVAQVYWPSSAGGQWQDRDGGKARPRIPEPRHSEYLLWLDRQSFADLVLLHNIDLRDGRLVSADLERLNAKTRDRSSPAIPAIPARPRKPKRG